MASFMHWQRIFFVLLRMKPCAPTNISLTHHNLCGFPLYNFSTFIYSLVCLTNLFFKPQDNTAELYELGALGRGLDTQKKLAERAFTLHGEAVRRSEENHDPEVCISTTYRSLKGEVLCMSFYTAANG